jgi:alpha-L-fucosidase 2
LTLDRGDVWDLRYQPNDRENYSYSTLRELVAKKDHAAIQREMTADIGPLNNTTPTRISIGRINLQMPEDTRMRWATLDMKHGEVYSELTRGEEKVGVRVLAASDPSVILVSIFRKGSWQPSILMEPLADINPRLGERLGYPQPERGSDQRFSWAIQELPESGRVATVWTTLSNPKGWHLLLTVTRQDEPEPLEKAKQVLESALRDGPGQTFLRHRDWWSERWSRASVHLPDVKLQRLWVNGIYKLASSSYRGAPPGLQGLWSPDGVIPPWRGDYHTNMNVQQTYWPAYSSNQLDLVEPLNEWLVERVAPEARELTQRFFGVDGMWIGTALDIEGRLLGGESNWMTVQYWLGAGTWLAQHLWWFYQYKPDQTFLRDQAYPFLKDTLLFWENILEKGEDGKLHVPLSSSPEYFSNDLEAWTPDPTSDLALIRNLIKNTVRASEILGLDEELRQGWSAMAAQLVPALEEKRKPGFMQPGGLMLQPGAPYSRSHRHPMHLFSIFPGEELTVEGSAAERRLLKASIDRWIFAGMGEWTGWSYPYGSLIASRIRSPEHALNLLQLYEKAFIWPNGFHINGDYKDLGFSLHRYEAFTVEAECGFTAAINEMLLQSWGEKIRIFPSVPEAWNAIAFSDLRAQGGFLVSAEMRQGRIVSASIRSETGGTARLVRPFGYVAPGDDFEVQELTLKLGETRVLAP